MEKLSNLLILLSVVTSNIYLADSYALNTNYLTQMGYNTQSTYININDNEIDSIDPNALSGYSALTDAYFLLRNESIPAFDFAIFKDSSNLDSLWIDMKSLNKLTNTKNVKLPVLRRFYLYTNLTSLTKPIFNALPALNIFVCGYFGYSRTIKTIDVHTFESLSNLAYLEASYNLLTGFEYLQIPKNLKELNLERNNMNYFALSRTMGVLKILRINNNLFRSFKSMDFTFLANLTEIYLQSNPHAYPNEISGHMKPLVNLQKVDLRNLSLNTIDSNFFKTNTKLQYIDLSQNKINYLDSGAFNGLINLVRVEISDDAHLTTIQPGTFANLPNLQEVVLENNQLTQLDSSIFAGSNNLKKIYVDGNPNLSTANIQSLCPPAATNCLVYY